MVTNARGDVWIDGSKLKQYRDSTGINQATLAQKIGVTRNWVGDTERAGKRLVLRELASAAAAAIGMTYNMLTTTPPPKAVVVTASHGRSAAKRPNHRRKTPSKRS